MARLSPVGNGYVCNQKVSPDFVAGARGNVILDGLVRGFFRTLADYPEAVGCRHAPNGYRNHNGHE